MRRDLHFAGRAVTVNANGASAGGLVDFMFGQVPSEGPAQAHVALALEDGAERHTLCFTAPETEDPAGHPGSGTLRGTASQLVTSLLYEVDYHLANLCGDGLYLHAACLARAGQGLLLPAASGSGKSTLAYWLTRHGFDYLSDESTFIPLNSLDCFGFTRPLYLKKGSLDLFPDMEAQPKLEARQADESLLGWLVAPAALNAWPMTRALPLRRLVFPRYRAGAGISYERLSPARGAFELAGCLTNARNLPEHGFLEIGRLARALPAWRLTYGELAQVDEFFESIFQ